MTQVIARGQSPRSNPAVQRSGAPGLLRARRALAVTVLLASCASPEAARQRGQAGADVKNWGRPIEMHAGAQPYHDTPCVTEPVECHGPLPVFGPTPPPD
jgi:hypothetical protein